MIVIMKAILKGLFCTVCFAILINVVNLTKAEEPCTNPAPGWLCGYQMGTIWWLDLSNAWLLDAARCCKESSPSNSCHITYEEEVCARLRANLPY